MKSTEKVFRRIVDNLDPARSRRLAVASFVVDDSPLPYLRPGTNNVLVSPAFAELAERLAFAVARDPRRPGYLTNFLVLCAAEASGVAALPPWDAAGADGLQVDNDQRTAFFQIVAVFAATELAHHCLGQHAKLTKSNPRSADIAVAIKTVLTESDTRKAFKDGVEAATRAGYTTEAVQTLAVALEKSGARPNWAPWLVGVKPYGEALAKELQKAQNRAVGR